jgi:hypothetical protein
VRRALALPFLLVGVMGLLVVGALLLGLFQAPNSTVLYVHNAAGETAAASNFTATYAGSESATRSGLPPVGYKLAGRLDWTAPDEATVTRHLIGLGSLPPSTSVAHVKGSKAQSALQPLTTAQQITNFQRHGSVYVGSQYLVGDHGQITESIVDTIRVANGYLVVIDQNVRLASSSAATVTRVTFHFRQIAGWTVTLD